MSARNGTTPSTQISKAELAKRNEHEARRVGLAREINALEEALVNARNQKLKADGRWEEWRDDVESRHSMTRADRIETDGTIVRA